jgi:hypothetical protein
MSISSFATLANVQANLIQPTMGVRDNADKPDAPVVAISALPTATA